MNVAVVCNRPLMRIVDVLDSRAAEATQEEAAERVAEDLRDAGHTSIVCEGDVGLLAALERFMPQRHGCASGLVFNLAHGGRGECARAHIPAVLEMAGIPYTGPSPLGHALSFDSAVVPALLQRAGVPTPSSRVMRWPVEVPACLSFPVVVSARLADTGFGSRVARSVEELEAAVDEITGIYEGEGFVQDYPEGVAVAAALLGNDDEMEWLPLMEQGSGESEGSCVPGGLDERLASAVREFALTAFRVCGCQDYARIDFRIDRASRALVVGVDSMPSLDPGGPFALAALAAGRDHAALVERIVDVAHNRYYNVPAPRFDTARDRARR